MRGFVRFFGVLTILGPLVFSGPRGSSASEVKWIDLPVSTGGSVRALLGIPDGISKAPGVVYSHGTFVRRLGYDAAKAKGYDVADYVEALNKAGFVALAPIRDEGVLPDPFNARRGEVGRESKPSIKAGMEQGIASLQAAVAFLREHPTATGKVGGIGFSEGGLVTLWSLLRKLDTNAAVLMSPATFKKAGRLNMKNAAKSDGFANIKGPVLITLGEHDNPAILKGVKSRLIPKMKDEDVTLETRLTYPGDHSWFWKVQPEHFSDVRAFLIQHLN